MSFKNHGNDPLNRAQRRYPANTPAEPSKPLQIDYGTDGTHVVMHFSRQTDNIKLTEKQAMEMIDLITKTIALIHEHNKMVAS